MRDYRNRDNISINPKITNCNNHGWTYVFNSFSENPSITVTLLNFPYTENPSFLEWNFPMRKSIQFGTNSRGPSRPKNVSFFKSNSSSLKTYFLLILLRYIARKNIKVLKKQKSV